MQPENVLYTNNFHHTPTKQPVFPAVSSFFRISFEMKSDFAIIGGGLSGMMMASRLVCAGYSVTLFEQAHPYFSASRIAAGLYNPVTGKRIVKTWLADQLLSELQSYFENPAFISLKNCLISKPIYRPFHHYSEYNDWFAKSGEPEYIDWVAIQETPFRPEFFQNPYGGLWIMKGGWLAISEYLQQCEQLLAKSNLFIKQNTFISPSEIDLSQRSIRNQTFGSLIFCEGILSQETDAPFHLWALKGQVITLEIPGLVWDEIITLNGFLLPLGNHHFRAGSSYEREFDSPEPTEDFLQEILQHWQSQFPGYQMNVKDHKAGIRPTTRDRRPVVGEHPGFPKIYYLNGLGTKGVLLSPFCTKHLFLQITENQPIHPEISISRKAIQKN